MCIPFAMMDEHVGSLSPSEVDWVGEIGEDHYWFYLDNGLLLVFGGIPWQVSSQNLKYISIKKLLFICELYQANF
jgi:hypothetical protein